MTKKEWHSYYIEKVSKYISENMGECDFIECGVRNGGCSMIMAKIIDGNGYLFDTWTGFPHFSEHDGKSKKRVNMIMKRMNTNSHYEKCCRNLKKYGVKEKCTMIKGDICKTVPDFVSNNNIKIGMMHIDTDLYEPANVSLESFWNMMLPGSVIFFHDYGAMYWPGIKKVVDEFVGKNKNASLLVFSKDKLSACCIVNGNKEELEKYIGVDNG